MSDIFIEDYQKTKRNNQPYSRWLCHHLKEWNVEYIKQEYEPLISVIVFWSTGKEYIKECVESFLGQTYQNFELCIIDDCLIGESECGFLEPYSCYSNIKVIHAGDLVNNHEVINEEILSAEGEFIIFINGKDYVEPCALAQFVYYLNEHPNTDFVYSDEDKVGEFGKDNNTPFFKPDWSPDTFMSFNYVNNLSMFKRKIVCDIGGFSDVYDGMQAYDMILRFMECSDNKRVGHVPKILFHQREIVTNVSDVDEKEMCINEEERRIKEDAIRRRNIDAIVEYNKNECCYQIKYNTTNEPLVSIIIPSKNNLEMLKRCIDSISNKTVYDNYEIIVVDNGSNKDNKDIISSYLKDIGALYIYEQQEFNFSKMCNSGVKGSNGEYVLLLNDDVEVINGDWLSVMLGQAMQPHTGAVGAKLLYPDGRIQHIGVCNIAAGPSHMYAGCEDVSDPFYRKKYTYNYIAITGACLMVSRKLYDEVGGLDENLSVSYNDVDFCFSLYEKGLYNLTCMSAVLYHHESYSRGNDMESCEKRQRLMSERTYMYDKHQELMGNDPFYNVNMSGVVNDFSLNMVGIDVHNYDVDVSYNSNEDDGSIKVSVDEIIVEDAVIIRGWAYTNNPEADTKSSRTLLLRSKTGLTMSVPVTKLPRADLKDSLCIDSITEGFEVIIDAKNLALHVNTYDIGLLQIDENGDTHFAWSNKKIREIVHKDVQLKYYSREIKKEDLCICDDVMYNIDKCDVDNYVITDYGAFRNMTYIEGWAFIPGSKGYEYRIDIGVEKEDRPGVVTLFDTLRLPRYDVADAMLDGVSYLSGFVCSLPFAQEKCSKIHIVLTNMLNNNKFAKSIKLSL